MFIFFTTIVIFIHLQVGYCSECPTIFKRFSRDHSFCKPRNPQCSIITSGLQSEREKEKILSEHNKYRSKCAVGNETGAGGLPMAADMMEMVWDEELAAIAQKWAEQCEFNHDCNTCREVSSYNVGQNIGYKQWSCRNRNCRAADKLHQRDWAAVIKMFTDEIKLFDKNLVKSIQFVSGKNYGHLTQIIWAKSWRVGCGYVAHIYKNEYRQLYVCNYGPSGNIISKPVYTEGKPCSQCPLNACCGESCKQRNSYPGLCRMLDSKSSPVYRDERRNAAIFYADFRKDSQADNPISISGVNKWKIRPTFSGNLLQIVLNGGESSTIRFSKAILPTQSFCVTLKYRKGPNVAGQADSSEIVLLFEPEGMLPVDVHVKSSSSDFFTYNLDLGWNAATKFSMKFSVPFNAPPQYLDMQSMIASNGKCKTNT